MMKRLMLAASLLAAPAFAGELEGVKVDDSITVGGKTVTLNGMGLRRKFIVNVYVGCRRKASTSRRATTSPRTSSLRSWHRKIPPACT